jgi:MFS family permease
VAVVTAPALVALIVAFSSPGVAVIAGAALGAGSALGFTRTGASRRWRGEPHDAGRFGPFAAPGMRTVFGVLLVFGTAVGIVQVAVPAFADQHGSAATAGVLLAALSAGSLAGGLLYGARTWPGTPNTRLPTLMLLIGGMFALLATADSQLVLAALLVACGLLFAPTTVVSSTLLDTVAPQGTVTEAFAAMVMGIVAGTAAGNALGGTLVEGSSYATSVLVAGAIAAAGSVLALTRRRTLEAHRAPDTRRRSAV